MKDAEDEAFDELAKRQGHWGGGYQAKRQMAADKFCDANCVWTDHHPDCNMAADKLQEPVREALKLTLDDIAKIPTLTHGLLVKLADVEAVIKESLAQPAQEPANDFYPDYDTEAVLVEEMQRMAKRIEELEAMLERQTSRIVDLQAHIANLEGEN